MAFTPTQRTNLEAAPRGGSGWVNIQRYLGANEGQAGRFVKSRLAPLAEESASVIGEGYDYMGKKAARQKWLDDKRDYESLQQQLASLAFPGDVSEWSGWGRRNPVPEDKRPNWTSPYSLGEPEGPPAPGEEIADPGAFGKADRAKALAVQLQNPLAYQRQPGMTGGMNRLDAFLTGQDTEARGKLATLAGWKNTLSWLSGDPGASVKSRESVGSIDPQNIYAPILLGGNQVGTMSGTGEYERGQRASQWPQSLYSDYGTWLNPPSAPVW